MDARARILDAFRELVLSEPFDEFRTQDVIDRAGVARSTFYTHFHDKHDLVLHSMGPILDVLRGISEQRTDADALTGVLEHIWENRRIARLFFQPPMSTRLAQALIDPQMPGSPDRCRDARTHFVVNGLLGTIAAWVSGRIAATPAELAAILLRLGRSAG